MLIELNIQNIALIEKLRVEFSPGLNVLTGETGAGKSIVVDSMNLALGGRTDRDLIRTGSERASVQAVFDVRGNDRVLEFVREMGLEAEDGYLTVSRELSASGRNLCRAAGSVVPLSQLKKLAGLLVELHGQHEHQALMSKSSHMEIIDSYGDEGHASLRAEVARDYGLYELARRDYDNLSREMADRERTIDILKLQLGEIDAVKPKPGEDEKLEKRFAIMGNAEKIASNLKNAVHLVYEGSDRSPSAQEALKRASSALKSISQYDERLEKLGAQLDDMYYQVQDAGYELQALSDEMEFDPAAFDKIGARLGDMDKLKKKYGPTLDEVLSFREGAAARLGSLEQGDERLTDLKVELRAKEQALNESCVRLSSARAALANDFAGVVAERLGELGMPNARFEARLSPAKTVTASGADEMEFMISVNMGEPVKPLSTTASGGELSRIMLTIKTVMAAKDAVNTMIFDEIDTGISGRMAQVVGEKMAEVARSRQVIAVSHLPQIAALADAHYIVEKSSDGVRTGSRVRRLNDEGRVEELARIVGGAGGTESGMAHARTMLADAHKLKLSYR